MKKNASIKDYGITGKDGKPLEIPVKGSIALLALGYRGLMAWRNKRMEDFNNNNPLNNSVNGS